MKITRRVREPADILKFDNDITAPLFGWKNRADYYQKASCYHRIPMIKVPTLFLNAIDDPIIGNKAIDYDVFKGNKNCILATT